MLIFGTKKLRNIGADLGGAVRGFKDGMREGGEKPPTHRRSRENRGRRSERQDRAEGLAFARRNRGRPRGAFCSLGQMFDIGFTELDGDRRGRAHRDRPGEAAARGAHRRPPCRAAAALRRRRRRTSTARSSSTSCARCATRCRRRRATSRPRCRASSTRPSRAQQGGGGAVVERAVEEKKPEERNPP